MVAEGAQQHPVVANGVSDPLRLHHQIVKLGRRQVGQGIALGHNDGQLAVAFLPQISSTELSSGAYGGGS
jgi:hypothetical protein